MHHLKNEASELSYMNEYNMSTSFINISKEQVYPTSQYQSYDKTSRPNYINTIHEHSNQDKNMFNPVNRQESKHLNTSQVLNTNLISERLIYTNIYSEPLGHPNYFQAFNKSLIKLFFEDFNVRHKLIDIHLLDRLLNDAPTLESRFLMRCIMAAAAGCCTTINSFSHLGLEYYEFAIETFNPTSKHYATLDLNNQYYKIGMRILDLIKQFSDSRIRARNDTC